MFARTRRIVALAALAAVSIPAAASSAPTRGEPSAQTAPTRSTSEYRKTRGTGPVRPIKPTGPTVMAITAFPTGGKGSGTEATCELWSNRLQEAELAQEEATDKQDVIDATNGLNEDIDNALDAGCVVIYSAARPQGSTGPAVTTVSVARLRAGGPATTQTWTPGPSVAYISAFPTGGKGSGTEATCALWSEELQADQRIIDNAPDTDKDDASRPLEEDIEHALDAGCVVIY